MTWHKLLCMTIGHKPIPVTDAKSMRASWHCVRCLKRLGDVQ